MLQLRRALPSLVGRAGALGTAPTRGFAAAPQQPADKPAEDDDTYELLPPGCSLREPSYGRDSMSDPVLIYDSKPVEEYRPLKKRQAVPQAPLNVEAAQAKLQASKESKKKQGSEEEEEEEEEDDTYVYLPPGSSMRDPVTLPNSLSDPLDRRVYYRDPSPTLRSTK